MSSEASSTSLLTGTRDQLLSATVLHLHALMWASE